MNLKKIKKITQAVRRKIPHEKIYLEKEEEQRAKKMNCSK